MDAVGDVRTVGEERAPVRGVFSTAGGGVGELLAEPTEGRNRADQEINGRVF